MTKQVSQTPFFGTTYFTVAYTYGHSIDDSSGFRNRSSQVPSYNPGIFRSSSDFDIRHRVSISGGWDLPFDRAWPSGPKRLVAGWSVYPIFTWRTGFPLNILAGLSPDPSLPGPSGAGDGGIANVVFAPGFSSLPLINPSKPIVGNNGPTPGNYYFNPAAVQCGANTACVPTTGYGLPRNFFRGPGRTNLDMALAKATPITERFVAEFRVEAFNVFNHTEFANLDVNPTSSTFGQITTTDIGSGTYRGHTERILQLGLRLSF